MQETNEFTNKSLLVVDDEDMNIFIARKFLKKIADFTLFTAESGKQALETLQSNDVDVLLTDLNMPIMDGYELASSVRQELSSPKSDIPIIALTGDEPESEKLAAAGINDFLLKPFTKDTLLEKLQNALQIQ